jgi:large subunit ribosomal protein L19
MALSFKHGDDQFSVGDTVKVNYKIREKDKERIQAFDGTILSIISGKFIVQKHATNGVTVERYFPIDSPWIESIKKLRSPKRKIRRSKLYFLRDSKSKKV